MGCDIHMYTERKNSDGDWICADFYEVNSYYDESDKDDDWEQPLTHIEFYKGRNYELFGALAGVRTDAIKFVPPRGVPDDSSKECLADFKRWDSDAHTSSWLTLAELRTHQKDIGDTVKRSGMISPAQMEDLKAGVKPESWCGWTNREDYIQAEWEDKCCPLDGFMEQLDDFLKLKYWKHEIDNMDEESFRVVFWFDN